MKRKRIMSAIVTLIFIVSLVGTTPLSVFAEGEALANLTWSDIANDQIKSFVVKDLNLVSTLGGESVSWTSTKSEVISEAGKVTRTNSTESVTLTATSGDATKIFEVIVPSIFSGDVKASYNFDEQTVGTSALTAYSGFTSTLNTNHNVSDYKIAVDTIDGGENKALVSDLKVGFKKYTAAQKEALLASTNVLTYVSGSDTYTYYLETEPKVNSTGTYFNGLLKKNGNIVDDGFYIGVYVTYDEAGGTYSVDSSKFKLGNHRWIYEDGSPFINIADGKPNSATLNVAAPGALGTFNGGEATISFRIGFDSGEAASLIGSAINIPTKIGGSTVTFGQNLITSKDISVKFDENTVVTGSTSQYLGKTHDTLGIYNNTDSLTRMGVIGSGVWRDVVVEYDYDADTARMYYNGRPVFWTVKSGAVTKYSSEIDISSVNSFPGFSLTADRFYQYHDTDIMIDDITWTYITAEEKEELICPAWTEIANDQLMSSVIDDLNLPTVVTVDGVNTPVVWTSSNETVISETGKVTRGFDTKYVTIIATIGDVVKAFEITVPAKTEGATVVSYSFDDKAAGTAGGDIDGMTETANGTTVDYLVATDGKDKNNNILYFDSKIGYDILSTEEKNDLYNNGTKYDFNDGSSNTSFYTHETTPKTDSSGNRYFTGRRLNRGEFRAILYVKEENGVWVVDTAKASTWDHTFDESGNKASGTNNQLSIAAPSGSSIADGLYSINLRFAEPETNVSTEGYGNLTFQTGKTNIFTFGRSQISANKSMHPEFVIDSKTNTSMGALSSDLKATYVGKTADVTGNVSAAELSSKLDAIPTRKRGEWAELSLKYDFNTDIARMYYNGKPVYWTVTYNDETIYCSDMVVADNAVPTVDFFAPTTLNGEIMIDDVKLTYTSSQQQAELLANELPYVKAGVLETDLILGVDDAVTYTAEKLMINGLNATVNSALGFGTETDVITATATVNGKTATKEHNIVVKKRSPYVVNSVVMKKDKNRVYTPGAGVVIEKITFDINDNTKTGVAAYVAKYNQEGQFEGVVKTVVGSNGEASVNLTLSEGETYKVFTFDGSLVPCTLAEEAPAAVKDSVKLFVIGDGVSKSVARKLSDKFTGNVAVDYSQTLIGASAKTALSGGSLDYVIANATACDYVLIGLGMNDTKDATVDEYTALVAQLVKAAENSGMTVVLVTPVSGASDYTVAMKELAEKFGVACVDTSSLGIVATGDAIDADSAETAATYVATQIKALLLPIACYVK